MPRSLYPQRKAQSTVGHYSSSLPPLRARTYPLPPKNNSADPWAKHANTGCLPSIAAVSQHIVPRQRFSRWDEFESSKIPLECNDGAPYRCARPSGVSIERGHRLSGRDDSPSKRNATRHMVLYTHKSPFITSINTGKKMTPADFEKLSDKSGYSPNELLKFHKMFTRLTVGKGVDVSGLSQFLARFANVDPGDEFVCRRLFELINRRGQPHVSFDQVIGLLQILKPPGIALAGFESDTGALADAPNTIAKLHLFFDIIDTNQSGFICVREIQDLTATRSGDIDIAKERRKMMVEKVTKDIYDFLGKTRNGTLSRDELLHVVGGCKEIRRFFSKALYLAANLQ